MSMQVEDVALHEKMGKKLNRSKKKHAGDIEAVPDFTSSEPVEVENNLKSGKEHKKKKSKKSHLTSSEPVEENNLKSGKEREKKKSKKSHLTSSEPVEENNLKSGKEREKKKINKSHLTFSEPLEMEKKLKSGKEHKKEKSKKSHLIGGETELLEGEKTANDEVGKGPKILDKMNNEVGKGVKISDKDVISEIEKMGEEDRQKKNKKRARKDKGDVKENNSKADKESVNSLMDCDKVGSEEVKRKKRRTEKRKEKDHDAYSYINKTQDTEANNGEMRKREKTKSVENDSKNSKSKGKSKKVRFSGEVEVFPSSDHENAGNRKDQEDNLVRGKRFSREEDEIVKQAVFDYIETHGLGKEGLKMVLNCKAHPEVKNCWKDIGTFLPHRPYTAVYYRAHILFERAERHKWTKEEVDLVQQFQEKHGNNWKVLAEELGKHRIHVKDTWRRIKLNRNKGNWSQEEYQNLFDLVNMDLRMKAFEEKKSKHGMLRDNICWGAISDKLATRSNSTCCMKWYNQLTSSMVADGIWADSDDYRLLDALFNLDACCIEDVDWDDLLDHRSGDVCRKRWDQMVLHIGVHGNKSFAEQVEILAKRYCPDLLEAREAWENKPMVP